jgi:hypothetical protein
VCGLVEFRVEDDLGFAFPISQINENDAAVIPSAVYPAPESNMFTDIRFSKGIAMMGNFQY